jgi:predicted ribosome quality control (RQC) complex YloA/Tae2 family protein
VFQGATQINGDRAVNLAFQGRERGGALICELTSRHGNIFWVDETSIIQSSFHPNRSLKRPLLPGEPYVPLLPRPSDSAAESRFAPGPDIEDQVAAHYDHKEIALRQAEVVARTGRLARKGLKHLDRLIKKLDQDRERAAEGQRFMDLGHLLKANLSRARKGQTSLAVDGFDGCRTTIPLDPRRSPVANMEQLFSRAKRLKKAVPLVGERQTEIREKRSRTAKLRDEIDTAAPERLVEIEAVLRQQFKRFAAQADSRKNRDQARLPYREYIISGGRPARVGRSARDNDELTLRHAKPDDLWLHVRGQKGSHVVVPLGRGEDPTPALLIDAAHLAAHFSAAKSASDVEVIYTRRRYVQKPKGAPPGSVRLLKEKNLGLRLEPERLSALLAANR